MIMMVLSADFWIQWGIIGLVIGLIAQVLVPGFPKEPLLIIAGSYYGLVLGTLINWVGMVLGAQLAYELARKGKMLWTKEDSSSIRTLHKGAEKYGLKFLFFLRMFPFSPNDVLSYGSGFIAFDRKGYFKISIITAFPYALLFAWLGDESRKIQNEQGWIILLIIISLMSFVVLLIAIIAKPFFEKRLNNLSDSSEDKLE
ncbi:MAG: TVP38/TMEM64 family protein [Candidatus Kariarchaeaceae archaeon]